MIVASRPLRFLILVVTGWSGARAILLWPAQIAPALVDAVAPTAMAAVPAAGPIPTPPAIPVLVRFAGSSRPAKVAAPVPSPLPDHAQVGPPAQAPLRLESTPTAFDLVPPPDPAPAGVDAPPAFRGSRWSGSAWAILRPAGRATPFASQLGGSQAGARIAYAIDGARRVAVYARASIAVDSPQREAAIGLDWRPTRLPVHLVAEQRIGIEGVRGGTALGAIGGFGPMRVAGPVRAEAYAQAGIILRDGHEGFADGSLRMTVPVVPRVDLGLGAWGGAQKGASRVDVGPTLGVTLPVERHALRLSVDWRQRVVGDARPGSGPAVSAGVDF